RHGPHREPAVDPRRLVHGVELGCRDPEDRRQPLDEGVALGDGDEGTVDLDRGDVAAGHHELSAAVVDVAPGRLVLAGLPGQLLGLLGDGGAFGDLHEPEAEHEDREQRHEGEPDHGEPHAVLHNSPRTLPLINRFIKGATTKLRTRFERGTKIRRRPMPVLTRPPWPNSVPITKNKATPARVSAATHRAVANGPMSTRWAVFTAT